MSLPARQSTALELSIGPVLDADGDAVTDCVVADFKLKKTTGNYAALNGSATLAHVSAGTYDLVLTTSDVDTVGLATVSIDDTVNTCAPVRLQVIEEAVYDRDYAASAVGYITDQPVNTTKVGGTTQTARDIGASVLLADGAITNAKLGADTGLKPIHTGTAQAGSSTTITLDSGASATNNTYKGLTIRVFGPGPDQTRIIVGYVGSTKVATVDRSFTSPQPDNTSIFAILPNGPVDVEVFGGLAGTFNIGLPYVNTLRIGNSQAAADNLSTAFADTAGASPWTGIVDQGTAQSATSTTVVLRSAAAFADDALIGSRIMVFGSTQGYWQSRPILDNVLSTDTVTVAAWDVTPSGTITYKIFSDVPSAAGSTPPSAADIRAEIDSNSTQLAAIVADTNELQTDWADGGRLDLILDARASQTSVNTIDTEVGVIDGIVDDIKAKTDNLPSDPADQSIIISATDAILTAVGDVPTVAEFEARTLPAADYFDPATDAVANVTTVGTVTTVTGLTASNLDATVSSRLASASYTAPPTAAQNATELLDQADGVESGWTLRQGLRIVLAWFAGKRSGFPLSPAIRNPGDTKTRISATIDADGNTSGSVTTDVT